MIYFKVTPGTKAEELFIDYYTTEQIANAALTKWLNKYTLSTKYYSDSHGYVAGVQDVRPEFVDQFKKAVHKTLLPRAKTEAGKELKELPRPVNMRQWSEANIGHGTIMGTHQRGLGFAIHYAHWACGDKGTNPVLYCDRKVKEAATKWPEGLVEITETEAMEITGSNEAKAEVEDGTVF